MKSWVYKRENCKSHQIKLLSKDIAGIQMQIQKDNKVVEILEVHLPNNLIVMLNNSILALGAAAYEVW